MESRTSKTKTWASSARRRQAKPSRNCGREGDRLPGVLRRFNSDTSGTVTVEFVVFTAAIVSMGVMAAGALSHGVESSIAKTEGCLINTAGNLAFKEGHSAMQIRPGTEQRCGRLLGFKEVATDAVTVKLVR